MCPVDGLYVQGVIGGQRGHSAVTTVCVDVVGNPFGVDKTEENKKNPVAVQL